MRILVCGGRDFDDWELLFNSLVYEIEKRAKSRPEINFNLHGIEGVTIISGMARGADSLAADFAVRNRMLLMPFPADWKKYGKSAGFIRNQQMLDEGQPDLVIAFSGGRGTADMVNRAKKAGVEVVRK